MRCAPLRIKWPYCNHLGLCALQISLCKNDRAVSRLAKVSPAAESDHAFSPTGQYVVTGGLGGLGLLFAEWLVDHGAKNLILTSRRGVATPSSQPILDVLAEKGANVVLVAADVSKPDSVAKIKAAAPNLRGVLHAAGVLDDANLVDLTWDRFVSVMAPKVEGTWHTHELCKGADLDFYVLFSSVTSILGNPGQANYGAANAFMDAFSVFRRSQGLKALSINWGPWSQVGMAANIVGADKYWQNSGFGLISPGMGLDAYADIMNMSGAVLVQPMRWKQLIETRGAAPLILDVAPKSAMGAQGPAGDSALAKALASVDASDRDAVLRDEIKTIIAGVLGLPDGSAVGTKTPFNEMGLDSLMSVDLRTELGEAAGQTLPGTVAFDYPNVDAMAIFLAEKVLKIGDSSGGKAKTKKKLGASEPLAIIGRACHLPTGATTPDIFWENLKSGTDSIIDIPANRFDKDEFFDLDSSVPGTTKAIYGGFIAEDPALFDASFFGITPKEATSVDPQQRFLMQLSWEAMENAGLPPNSMVGEQVGVFIGISIVDYELIANQVRGYYCDGYYQLGTNNSVAAGRISYNYGFQGPATAIDTACSSSLTAVHFASGSMRTGETDMVMCGGVGLMLAPENYINFSKAGMLCADGRCKTFDSRANGYVRGEGAGMIVAKRASDAAADGDVVLALIKGSAVNQDGRSSGLTAPNGPSQERCIRTALENGSLKPVDIGYIEAHGTGTSLGDPIEAIAVGTVLAEGREPGNRFVLGSAKTNLGHLEAAAGISGLIKLSMCVQHGIIPPHLNFKEFNPMIDPEVLPIKIPLTLQEWPEGYDKRAAGVSSFGFSGTNGHVICEEPRVQKRADPGPPRDAEVFVLSARSDKALRDLVAKVDAALDPNVPLRDICFTAAAGRDHFDKRLAVAGASVSEVKQKLSQFLGNQAADGIFAAPITPGEKSIGLLFSGHDSVCVDMGRELYLDVPAFKQNVDECSELFSEFLETPLTETNFFAGQVDQSRSRRYSEMALFTIQYALGKLLKSWGIIPAVVMGAGVGEYAAACIAGVFGLADAVALIGARGSDSMQKVVSGVTLNLPRTPYISCALGAVATKGTVDSSKYWLDPALDSASNTRGAYACLADRNCDILMDASPSPKLLSGAPAGKKTALVATLDAGQNGWASITNCMATAYINGAEVDWTAFFDETKCQKTQLPTYAWQERRFWVTPLDESKVPPLPAWHYAKNIVAAAPAAYAPAPAAHAPAGYAPAPAPAPAGSSLTYRMDWVPSQLAPPASDPSGVYVLLASDTKIASELAANISRVSGAKTVTVSIGSKFSASGGNYVIDPSKKLLLKKLFSALDKAHGASVRGFVHMWTLDQPLGVPDASGPETSCASVLELVKAMGSSPINGAKLTIVTKCTQPTGGVSQLNLIAAPLWGLGQGMAAEQPAAFNGNVDLGPSGIDGLAEEVCGMDSEDRVCLRNGQRTVGRLFRSELPPVSATFSGSATYLITGGLGALGLAMCEWMVAAGARRLVLTSRSGMPKDANSAAAVAVQALQASGAEVLVQAADVSNMGQMSDVIRVANSGKAPLKGVFHAAGVVSFMPMVEMDSAELKKIMRPKVAGTINLHTLTQSMDLDHFVLFSSISAAWGAATLAHYGAANEFLTAMAEHRKLVGLPATSLSWSVWDQIGMINQADDSSLYAKMGMIPIKKDAALDALGKLIGTSGCTVVADMNWGKFARLMKNKPLFSTITAAPTAGAAAPAAGRAAAAAAAAPAGPALSEFAQKCKSIGAGEDQYAYVLEVCQLDACKVMGLDDPTEVDEHRQLMDLGLDSMMAVDFVTDLGNTIGFELSATLTFDYPTMHQVANHIIAEVLPEMQEAAAGSSDASSIGSAGSFVEVKVADAMPDGGAAAAHLEAQLRAKTAEAEQLSRQLRAEQAKATEAMAAARAASADAAAAKSQAAAANAAASRASRAVAPAAASGGPKVIESSVDSSKDSLAVLGMACRFPQSPDIPTFWTVLHSGTDTVSPVPIARWNIADYYDADMEAPGKIYVKEGGFIEDIELFDPEFFGISPREAVSMDPQQRVLLETAYEALEDANINTDTLLETSTGVYVGVSHSDYRTIQVHGAISNIDHLFGTGTSTNVIAGRLSYILGMKGPALAVDTACSSSLVALHLGYSSIARGETTMSVACGVHIMLSPELMVNLCRARMLSPQGRCKTFDESANGYGRGEGCGVLAVKSLAMAMADSDDIRAIVKGSALNQDGRTSGLTAPNGPSQQSVIRAALKAGDLQPLDVSYVECHGTATPLGDPIEVQALGAVYGKKRDPSRPFVLGAVKTNVGHLESGSGSAGLIKLVLAIEHEVIPPNVHFKQANKHINMGKACAMVPTQPTNWPAGISKAVGVSSFGFSGTNAHILVEEAPASAKQQVGYSISSPSTALSMFVLTARSESALKSLAGKYSEFVANSDASVADICFSARSTRAVCEHRLALPVASSADLAKELATYAAGKPAMMLVTGKKNKEAAKLAFLFTGQGSQYVNMGRDLYDTEPVFAATLDQCADILRPLMKHDLLSVLWGTAKTGEAVPADAELSAWLSELNLQILLPELRKIGITTVDGVTAMRPADLSRLDCKLIHRKKLTKKIDSVKTGAAMPTTSPAKSPPSSSSDNAIDETMYTQPALFAVEYALAKLWMSWGVKPKAVMGHSVGEYVAACVAGVFSLEDGLRLIATRAKLMDSVPRDGIMAACFATEERVASAV